MESGLDVVEGPPMLLQHEAVYRDFINTLPCLALISELRAKDSVLNDIREILRCQALFWLLGIKLNGVAFTFYDEQIRAVRQQPKDARNGRPRYGAKL